LERLADFERDEAEGVLDRARDCFCREAELVDELEALAADRVERDVRVLARPRPPAARLEPPRVPDVAPFCVFLGVMSSECWV
jgi:hypothetical protein